jgi:hypothetical protein
VTKFWIVYMYPHPRGGARVPRRSYKNHSAALSKAHQLAESNPGKEVHICELSETIKGEVIVHAKSN